MEKMEAKREMTMAEEFEVESKYYDEHIYKGMHMDQLESVFGEEGFREIYPEEPHWSQFELPTLYNFDVINALGIVINEDIHNELVYEHLLESFYRITANSLENGRRVGIYHPPLPHEDALIENFAYLSIPPSYLIVPRVGAPFNTQLFGKSCTSMWTHVNDFTRDQQWLHGYHLEDGTPSRAWVLAYEHSIVERLDEEDLLAVQGVARGEHATRDEILKMLPNMDVIKYGGNGEVDKGTEYLSKTVTGVPKENLSDGLERRHFATGIKIRDVPKHAWDAVSWAKGVKEFCTDMRLELLPEFQNATMYTSEVTTLMAIYNETSSGISSICKWMGVYSVYFTRFICGLNYNDATTYPMPAAFDLLRNVSMETMIKRLSFLAAFGYETINPIVCSKKKFPIEWRIYERLWSEGPFRHMFIGVPRGCMLSPMSICRTIYPIFAEEGRNIRSFLATSPSEEYWELLESDEVGVDRETGRIPPISEVFRLKCVCDPTYEPIPISKFPKLDFNVGQVWPFDMTVEKVEIMVNEGYSGLGDNIEHYSKLADKKMGKKDVEVPDFKPLSDYAKSYRKELGEVHPVYLENL